MEPQANTTMIFNKSGGVTTVIAIGQENQIPQIISDDALYLINIYLYFLVCGVIAVFGMANNIVNMIVFYKLGQRDSMSVGLMSLSLTDFLVSLLGGIRIAFFTWDTLVPWSAVRLIAVNQVSVGWLRDALFLCSGCVTAFLSVERCVCVLFPFKVKDIFTRTRSIIVVITIYVVTLGAHIPVFMSGRLEWAKAERETANGTVLIDRLVATFSDNWPQVRLFIDIAGGAVIPMPSQALVLISVVLMSYGLKVSSRVRSASSVVHEKEDAQNKKDSNLSNKERKLLKMVLFLAIIQTLCNIPRFVAVYAKQIFPQVNYGTAFWNLYIFLWILANASSIVNASVNIFVYLIINQKYRQAFLETFCRFSEKK